MKYRTKKIVGIILLAILGVVGIFLFSTNKKTPEEHLEKNMNTYIKNY